MRIKLSQKLQDLKTITTSYEITTKQNCTEIHYYIIPKGTSKVEELDITNLFTSYENELIQRSRIISKELTRKTDLFSNDLSEKFSRNAKDILSNFIFFRKRFNILQSFQKRKIYTHVNKTLVAVSIIHIFGDIKTIIHQDKSLQVFLPFHSMNVRYSEFVIASELKSFILNIGKFAEILAIITFVIPIISYILNFDNNLINTDIKLFTTQLIFQIIIPVLGISFRKKLMQIVVNKLLKHALSKLPML